MATPAVTYDQLLKAMAAERARLAGSPQYATQQVSGADGGDTRVELKPGDAGFIDYNDPNTPLEFSLNNLTGNRGITAAYDPASGGFTVAQGDATSGIQRARVTQQGTTDLGFESIDRNSKYNAGLGTMALLAAAVAGGAALANGGVGSLLGGAAEGGTAAGTAAGAGGAAGGVGSLLTPSNLLTAGSLLSSTIQARQTEQAMQDATSANERIAADQASAAERVRLDAERARQAAIAAGGSQPGRSPAGTAGARQRNRGGLSSTMLTGAGGVNPSLLSLSAPTLLGRLG